MQASKARQAKDRQGKLDKIDAQLAAARKLVVGERHKPRLSLAAPPPCDEVPLELRGATLRHAEGSQDTLTDLACNS